MVTILKCKMCGGDLDYKDGMKVAECLYCRTKQTVPLISDEYKANLYDRAGYFRRNNDYDKAMSIYEQLISEDNSDAEAHWSAVLCRYGIEYVEDPRTKKRIPTINRVQYKSIFNDADYIDTIKYAEAEQKQIYEAEAKSIDQIQRSILEISKKEKPFDVFICYKETDDSGKRTEDSVLAYDIYKNLTDLGYKVFFARITLEDKIGTAYEPYIFAALNSAKVMLVIGTKPEYVNAVWVKNEWSRFMALMQEDKSKVLIPLCKGMKADELPEEMRYLQAQDMSSIGFMQDLTHGIEKYVKKQGTMLLNKKVLGIISIAAVLLIAIISVFFIKGNKKAEPVQVVAEILEQDTDKNVTTETTIPEVESSEVVTDDDNDGDVVDNSENYAKYKKMLEEFMSNPDLYVAYDYEVLPYNENMSFGLFDLNKDGIDELLVNPGGSDIGYMCNVFLPMECWGECVGKISYWNPDTCICLSDNPNYFEDFSYSTFDGSKLNLVDRYYEDGDEEATDYFHTDESGKTESISEVQFKNAIKDRSEFIQNNYIDGFIALNKANIEEVFGVSNDTKYYNVPINFPTDDEAGDELFYLGMPMEYVVMSFGEDYEVMEKDGCSCIGYSDDIRNDQYKYVFIYSEKPNMPIDENSILLGVYSNSSSFVNVLENISMGNTVDAINEILGIELSPEVNPDDNTECIEYTQIRNYLVEWVFSRNNWTLKEFTIKLNNDKFVNDLDKIYKINGWHQDWIVPMYILDGDYSGEFLNFKKISLNFDRNFDPNLYIDRLKTGDKLADITFTDNNGKEETYDFVLGGYTTEYDPRFNYYFKVDGYDGDLALLIGYIDSDTSYQYKKYAFLVMVDGKYEGMVIADNEVDFDKYVEEYENAYYGQLAN